MSRRELFTLILKGLLAWLVLSGLVWYFGEWLAKGLFPLIKAVIMAMTSAISPSLKLIQSTQALPDDTIELSAWVLHPLYINASVGIPPGIELKASAHLLHALVPLVIEGSILLVWPVQRWTQRFWLLAFGLLTAVLVIMATLPAQLLGTLEISFQEVALSGNHPRPVPWFGEWMVFCEMGGRWLLAIAAAGWCIQLQRGLLRV
ncbi:MAG: hypothetical protein U1E13_02985 [Methylophilaceae bacterium]|nr:hypothetical protein [Methylophilaceae bacterium]